METRLPLQSLRLSHVLNFFFSLYPNQSHLTPWLLSHLMIHNFFRIQWLALFYQSSAIALISYNIYQPLPDAVKGHHPI